MKNKKRKALVSIALAATLSGCNAEDSGSSAGSSSASSDVSLSAGNNTLAALNSQPTLINLQGEVQLLVDGSSANVEQDNFIESVTPMDNQPQSCSQITVNNIGFSASYDGFVGTCVYQYTAANSQYDTLAADGYSIIVSEKEIPDDLDTFPHLSETQVLGDPTQSVVKINLRERLNTEIPEGYQLSPDATLIGPGSIEVNTENQTITYKSVDEQPGYAQIVYNYNGSGKVKLGTISITVSQSVNSAPDAPNIDYAKTNGQLDVGKKETIDLSNWVSDKDGDPLQLVRVSSWNADVEPTARNDVNNLSFDFYSTQAGEHFVDYVVSDHFGGLAAGTVRIVVVDTRPGDWKNIILLDEQGINPLVFIAPLTKFEADYQGIPATGSHAERGYSVATFNFDSAKQYCSLVGRLPSMDELNRLAGSGKVIDERWPKQVGYFSNTQSVINAMTGEEESPSADGQYVTCVQETEFSIITNESDTSAAANGKDTVRVKVKLTKNGSPVVGQRVQASVEGQAQLAQNSAFTNEQGIVEFLVTDTKAERVRFNSFLQQKGEEEVTRTIAIQFNADLNNLELVAANADPITRTLSLQVQDYYGNKPNIEDATFTPMSDVVKLHDRTPPMRDGKASTGYELVGPGDGRDVPVLLSYHNVTEPVYVPTPAPTTDPYISKGVSLQLAPVGTTPLSVLIDGTPYDLPYGDKWCKTQYGENYIFLQGEDNSTSNTHPHGRPLITMFSEEWSKVPKQDIPTHSTNPFVTADTIFDQPGEEGEGLVAGQMVDNGKGGASTVLHGSGMTSVQPKQRTKLGEYHRYGEDEVVTNQYPAISVQIMCAIED